MYKCDDNNAKLRFNYSPLVQPPLSVWSPPGEGQSTSLEDSSSNRISPPLQPEDLLPHLSSWHHWSRDSGDTLCLAISNPAPILAVVIHVKKVQDLSWTSRDIDSLSCRTGLVFQDIRTLLWFSSARASQEPVILTTESRHPWSLSGILTICHNPSGEAKERASPYPSSSCIRHKTPHDCMPSGGIDCTTL